MRVSPNFAQRRFTRPLVKLPAGVFQWLAALLVCAVGFTGAFSQTGASSQPPKGPISEDRLVRALHTRGMTTRELVERVENRGVSFRLTDETKAELVKAGARPALIEAVRANYKPAYNYSVPKGPPLSPNEVVSLLESGMGSERVQQYVATLGADFILNPDIIQKIKAAGGTEALVGTIAENSDAASGSGQGSDDEATAGLPDYDKLTGDAMVAMHANNPKFAIDLLQRAIALDGTNPKAYSLLAFAELYGTKDVKMAEQDARAAIGRGGSAAFRVRHVHDPAFETYCLGSMFVGKSSVSFKADDGRHVFDIPKAKMIGASLDESIGKQFAAFDLRSTEGFGNNRDNFFTPVTKSRTESNLIVNLIIGYR
ncbi:MAG TPA: hypothetical protein VLZ81_17945 [Blastocatellia bacterium]|nr:hypothetical protein [Blastocatellia bacterium]